MFTEENVISPEVIQKAEAQGWVDKDSYRGDPDNWVPADVFVKRGEEIMPILRKNNESLLKELSSTKEQLREFKRTAEEFKRFQTEAHERKVSELTTQLEQLKQAKAQAIADGDGSRVNQLDDAIDEVKDQHKAAKEQAKESAKPVPVAASEPVALDPTLSSWLDGNEWFGKDKKLTEFTNALGEELRAANPGLMGKAFLDKLDEALAEELPHKFGNKKSSGKPSSPVESGSGRGRVSSNKHSYDNLPSDAKQACDRFVKQGLMTREAYVQSFDWE